VIAYAMQGIALALPATLMPGPLMAFLLAASLRSGWKRTLPAALAPLASDGPIIALVLVILTRTPQTLLDLLRAAGGLFLLYLATGVLREWRARRPDLEPAPGSVRRTFLQAVLMNVLNPNPYLFWSVVMGPIVISAWRETPRNGIVFLAAFYATFVVGLATLIVLFGTVGRLDPRVRRALAAVSGSVLAGFGIYQLILAAGRLLG
jgi:threonine/homoserine/homoserine lactone efflux protein